tara:strand:- start:491 stop:649 length:159 start_codon:yes stop_codon:yes gene_type:complete
LLEEAEEEHGLVEVLLLLVVVEPPAVLAQPILEAEVAVVEIMVQEAQVAQAL